MKVFRRNGTSFWHYEFVLNGKRYHKSTKMKNEREALKVANAAFTAVVKGDKSRPLRIARWRKAVWQNTGRRSSHA